MPNRKTIIVLGGGALQHPLILESKNRGYKTVVIDGDNEAPGKKLADQFIHCDISNGEICLQRLREISDLRPDGVLTIGTDFTYTVALINAYFDLNGVSIASSLLATDKVLMRKAFKRHKVRQPKFTSLELIAGSSLESALKQVDLDNFNWPLVVKPADNMGARGCQQVASIDHLTQAVASALKFSKKSKIIIEEFVDGCEFSIDALINHGDIFIHGIADRIITSPPYFVELGHVMPSQCDKTIIQQVKDEFIRGINALGIQHGYAKGDIFYSHNRAVVGEIAARLSGGFMSGFTYPYASGINLTGLALDVAIDEFPGNIESKYHKCSIEKGILAKKSGKIVNISGLDEVRHKTGVKDVFMRCKPGQMIKPPKNNVEKAGNIIVVGDNYNEAKALSTWASQTIQIVTKKNREHQ